MTVRVQGFPHSVATGFGKVWVVGHRNGVIYAIDPKTARVVRTIVLGGTYYVGLGVGEGAVWIYRDDKHQLVKIDPESGRAVAVKPVGRSLTALTPRGGALWALEGGTHAVRIDPQTLETTARVRLPRPVGEATVPAFAESGGLLWVAIEGGMAALDPAHARIARHVRVAGQPGAIAVTPDRIWFVYPNASHLLRVGPAGGRVTRVGYAAAQPALLKLVAGRLLLTDDRRNSVTAFDSNTGRRGPTVVLRHGLPEGSVESIGLTGIVGTEDAVWVSDWAGNAVYRIPLAKLAP